METTEKRTSEILKKYQAKSKETYERTAYLMRIAAQIDDGMKAAGLSKIEFAKLMHKQPSVITKWLSGTHNFTADTLSEISSALNIEIPGAGQKNNSTNMSQTQITENDQEIWTPKFAYV